MSIVIRFCFGFELQRYVIGFKNNLRQFVSQSEFKPKPIVTKVTHSHTFSRALLASSFDWLAGLSKYSVIGQSGYLGFGATTRKWKPFPRTEYSNHELTVKDVI